jgi:hypothetical protein
MRFAHRWLLFQNKPIKAGGITIMAERAKICIDRVLPTELMRPQRTMRTKSGERAISPIGKTWMNGSTLRVRFMGGTANEQATAREQAGWWA